MAKTHRILRVVPGVEHLSPGTLIDATSWRTVDQLVKARYLEPITEVEGASDSPAEPAAPKPAAIGPNVKRLIAHRMTLDAIPPGGTVAHGVEFLLSGRLGECSKRASEWARMSLAALKAAADSPYGDDEEAIAAYLLQQIEEREQQQIKAACDEEDGAITSTVADTGAETSQLASAAAEQPTTGEQTPPSADVQTSAATAPAATRQKNKPAATAKSGT